MQFLFEEVAILFLMLCFDIGAISETKIVYGPGISIKMAWLTLDGPGRMFTGYKFDFVSGSSSTMSSGCRGYIAALPKPFILFSILATLI